MCLLEQCLQLLDLDVSEPDSVAMILQSNVSGLGHIGKIGIKLGVFTGFDHLFPFGSPEVILQDVFTVHEIRNGTLVRHNLKAVPLHSPFPILRIGGDHAGGGGVI